MIIASILGFLLCLWAIWLLKGTRRIIKEPFRLTAMREEPVLKMWIIIVVTILGILPVIGLLTGAILLFALWAHIYVERSWKYVRPPGRLLRFLSKPIE